MCLFRPWYCARFLPPRGRCNNVLDFDPAIIIISFNDIGIRGHLPMWYQRRGSRGCLEVSDRKCIHYMRYIWLFCYRALPRRRSYRIRRSRECFAPLCRYEIASSTCRAPPSQYAWQVGNHLIVYFIHYNLGLPGTSLTVWIKLASGQI